MKTSNRANIVIGMILMIFLISSINSFAEPVGPIVSNNYSVTATPTSAAMINTTGGSITTMVFNVTAQNIRWKAYVGNVSGTLTLDDANNHTIFDWSLSNVAGEVYATRSSQAVSWSNLNCSNSTHIYNEEIAMNHTDIFDNISATFSAKKHDLFYIGTKQIGQDACYSIHTFVNSTNQSSNFEEVLLYDGTNSTNGHFVYSTMLEQNSQGFDNNYYDFQMIVPENGLSTWSSATPYYFYVELT